MNLDEMRNQLQDADIRETFYDEFKKRFNVHDRNTMCVVRCLVDDVIIGKELNKWCILKTIHTRTKLKISVNDLHYYIIPKLVTIGFMEMKIMMTPLGDCARVVRLSERFIMESFPSIIEEIKSGKIPKSNGIDRELTFH